ncbi:MAG: helix-turn-helix transcriptional regulator [Actinomycetota bacterium]|jgi:transcriptional regulator with XRE-family HTH domain|nr:helix-turn-helix transcriptional regulator [Actinomycetota bacterium]NPV54546.1 helix-turn-helix transcriptional regulator [Bacillota bacterium]
MKAHNVLGLLLKINGLSRRRLADQTGIPRSYINDIASGRRIPTDEELLRICQALGVTPEMIYPNPELRKALAEV